MNIATDVDLAVFLCHQRPEVIAKFADMCDQMAHEQEAVSVYEVVAGAARALLRGEDPVDFQRSCGRLLGDYYEGERADDGAERESDE